MECGGDRLAGMFGWLVGWLAGRLDDRLTRLLVDKWLTSELLD